MNPSNKSLRKKELGWQMINSSCYVIIKEHRKHFNK